MGYWGWRPLLSALFICVLITGCTITNSTAPVASPTNLPLITLTLRLPASRTPTAPPTVPATATRLSIPSTVTPPAIDSTYIVRPGDTLLGIALDFGLSVDELRDANVGIDPLALQVGQIISIPPQRTTIALLYTPVPLTLDPPVCQYTITGGLLCLGQLYNPYDQPLNGVRIALTLLAADHTALHQITTGLEQTLIPPHGSAPYSAILPGAAHESVSAAVLSAQFVNVPLESARLEIVSEQSLIDQNRYQVVVTLRNASDQPADPARLILTVVDAENQVVGVRVADTSAGFAPGAEQTVHIEALTRSTDGPLSHRLYVETQPAR